MTPEQRFFPARGDDELWVHDDVLGAQGEPPQCEYMRALGASASENIGQGRGGVHGKSDGAEGPGSFWRRVPAGHLLLAVCCALLVHAAILGAVRLWLLPWWAMSGPQLLSLELSGIPGGGGGQDDRGEDAGEAAGPGDLDAPVGRMSDMLPLLGAAKGPRTPASPESLSVPKPSEARLNTPPRSAAPVSPPPKSKPAASAALSPEEPVSRPQEAAPPTQPHPTSGDGPHGPDAQDAAGSAVSGPAETVPGPGSGDAGASGSAMAGAGGDGVPSRGRGPGMGGGPGGEGRGPGGGEGGLLSFGAPGGPEIARMVMPEYPREARRLGKEGTVVLKISLHASGEVSAIDVLQTPGHGLDEAARDAVLRSRFRPATAGGAPVACQAILPVHFKLR